LRLTQIDFPIHITIISRAMDYEKNCFFDITSLFYLESKLTYFRCTWLA